ncbi:MAG TPA: DEAD/DEAH box helicase [Bacteroidia bacterium]|nr:DEAD/DEAH box helicase [Bacteroidia bacterium]
MKFSELKLQKGLLNALGDLGFEMQTDIQERSFPVVMSGKDMLGVAQTGTGKTIAYLLPVLQQLNFSRERHPRVLILVPTRELVEQVAEIARQLSKYSSVRIFGVYGESNINKQKQRIYEGLDILIATPGRLIDLMLSRSVLLNNVKKLVVDEVDEMFNLGFRPQLTRILDALPARRQNISFSATLSEESEKELLLHFRDPEYVETVSRGTALANIQQSAIVFPNQNTRINYLKHLLSSPEQKGRMLVFVRNKTVANHLETELASFSEQIGFIHSNKSQSNRFQTLANFEKGEITMLVATDVIARGLDLKDLEMVINFDFPTDPNTYIHRIGRTGRARQMGRALSLLTQQDLTAVKAAEKLMKQKIRLEELPPDVDVSNLLTEEEMPKTRIKKTARKLSTISGGGAFHEKKAKNKKVQLGGKRRQESQRRALALSRSKRKK